jgi:peroxiredoxin
MLTQFIPIKRLIRLAAMSILITGLLACAQKQVQDEAADVVADSGELDKVESLTQEGLEFDDLALTEEMRAILTEEQLASFNDPQADLNLTDEQVAALDDTGMSFLSDLPEDVIASLPADQVDAIQPGNNSKLTDETVAIMEEVFMGGGDGSSLNLIAKGADAPEIELMDNFGKKRKLSEFRGKYVLVDFWGTWCQPCVEALPKLAKVYQQIDKSKIEFVGVCADCPDFKEFITEEKLSWVQLSDPDMTVSKEYGVDGFPTVFLIDPQGKVIDNSIWVESAEELLQLINKLD